MDRSRKITLVSVSATTDSIGQIVETESTSDVFCNVSSVSRAEFFAAGKEGLKPSLVVTMFLYDYNEEKIAILDGKRYSVYRTYVAKNETIELYLEEKAGVTNVEDEDD